MGTQNFEHLLNLYHNIFVYCGIAAILFLIISVVLFFWLKIPGVFGELTGRDARKAIEAMAEQNADSGSLSSLKLGEDGRRRRRGRTGALATGRLRKNTGSLRSGSLRKTGLTDKIPAMPQPGTAADIRSPETVPQELETAKMKPLEQERGNEFAEGSQPTDVLDNFGSQPTDVLDNFGSQPTDVLNTAGDQSMDGRKPMAGADSKTIENNETLYYQEPASETMVLNPGLMEQTGGFVILRSIVEIHTDEVI